MLNVVMLTSRRLVKAVLPLALPGSLVLVSGRVFAADENEESESSLLTDELSLYSTPHTRVPCGKPEVGSMEQSVASLRKSAEPYTAWFQEKSSYTLDKAEEYYKTMEPVIDASVRTVGDTYEFLMNPPSKFYPSVGAVGFSAILGLYLAKGGRVKRLLFPTGLMTLSASVFYPQQAASLAKEAKNQMFSLGSQTRVFLEDVWKRISPGKEN
ncbi:apolipoprotein O, b isoform X1 [Tachysurus fulvidraco]|uniref:apolipoprotein O, b isoform X1 n=2 Tax=Tachysurus fulvidraco TaxID=1234273 RepID=UPI001FEF9B12|nr:apolipoprotein O, b isoform X1 [Tachysurus fulvidraco]